MKNLSIKLTLLSLAFIAFSAPAQNTEKREIPLIKNLPKIGEVKSFYELPDIYEYKVYDSKGILYASGKEQFIDITNYEKGTYFFSYNGKKVSYIVK